MSPEQDVMRDPNASFPVGIEFDSVLRAISKQIYETPHAFIRENVQNAIDAVRIQALRDAADVDSDDYRIDVQVEERLVIVRDNGIGMSRRELQEYFWTIGSSGKRGEEARDAGCVGMFGIGGFANFGVCDLLEVTSQDTESRVGTVTRLSAQEISRAGRLLPSVSVTDSDAAAPRGTIVVGRLNEAVDVDRLTQYLKSFVRFVPIAIRVNGAKISQGRFTDVREMDNLAPVGASAQVWRGSNLALTGHMWEDRGHTLVVAIEEMTHQGKQIPLEGRLRLEHGPIDVFKRGFKLCTTQVPSTIGTSGRVQCDLFVPTAGRDSLDASSASLLGQIAGILEHVAVESVLETADRIAQHTRVFRLVVQRNLVHKMGNVVVRLADGKETELATIREKAGRGVKVFFGTTQKHSLNQVMQAQGHVVVQLASDRHRRAAEERYLREYCDAERFDGMIDCAEVYEDLSRFERVFLSEVEQYISRSYEILDYNVISGRLTEDIPTFVKERRGKNAVDVFVDVRHVEVKKLEILGLSPMMYTLVGTFCREYIGPGLRRWSPRFFGDGAINLELIARRRSDLWVLVKSDVGVVRKGGERQVVTRQDVDVVNVVERRPELLEHVTRKHRLLCIVDEEQRTGMAGFYIRLPDRAFDAYGDLVGGCDARGVVWAGNKVMFVASDGVSAQFQYEIRLDEIVATEVAGVMRAEGALELERPVQEMFEGLYFPIPDVLERFLVPTGRDEIRLELHCEWIDMRTGKLWETGGESA